METIYTKGLNINFEDDSMVTARVANPYPIIPENDFEHAIVTICHELAETLIKKNRDYGDSYRKLKEEFGDAALIIRQADKLGRLKTLQKQGNLVNETKADTKIDAAGYYILDVACERVKNK